MAPCLHTLEYKTTVVRIVMRLTRREILEQLERLGIRGLSGLKRACREYEAYWNGMQYKRVI